MSTVHDFGTPPLPPFHSSVCWALDFSYTQLLTVLNSTGLYLTDVTFCREGNPSFRPSPKSPDKKLLNFNKYHKLARIVQGQYIALFLLVTHQHSADMQRFQIPYNLKQIPEVQVFLRDAFEKSARQGDLQDLYRRSLMVEPKHSTDTPPTSDVRQLFHWTRSQTHTPTPTSATAS